MYTGDIQASIKRNTVAKARTLMFYMCWEKKFSDQFSDLGLPLSVQVSASCAHTKKTRDITSSFPLPHLENSHIVETDVSFFKCSAI